MMPSKSNFFLSVLHQSMFYAAIYLLFLRVSTGADFSYLTALWVLLPVTGTTLFLAKAKKIWQFALLHLFFAIPPFLYAEGIFELIDHLIILGLMTILHYVDTNTRNQQACSLMPGIWGCLFHMACYFLVLWQKEPTLCTYFSYTFGISVILFLLYQYLDGRERFFTRNREIAELPEKQIYKVTRTIMILFFSILIMGIIMVSVSGAGNILGNAIGDAFAYLGNLILAWLRGLTNNLIEEGFIDEISNNTEMFPPAGSSEVNPLIHAISEILTHIFMFLIGALLIAAICLSIYKLIAHFRNELPEEKDKIEFLTPFARTEHYHSVKEKTAKPSRFDFSPTAQVRKIYYKAIQGRKEKKQKLSRAYTPSELEQAVSLDSQTLHELYEKARYSETGCNRSDLDLAKEQVKL